MGTLIQDLRYGLRMLARNPGFTAVAVVTLALGIGANTAIFTLIDAVMLKSLPVENPAQLVLFDDGPDEGVVTASGSLGGRQSYFSNPLYEYLRDHEQVFRGVCAFQKRRDRLSVRAPGSSEAAQRATGRLVSGNYFSVLGVQALLGRTLTSDDDRPSAHPAAVISYSYWNHRFNRDPSAVDRVLDLNDTPFTVVGVTPPEFFGESVVSDPPDFWLPMAFQPQVMQDESILNNPRVLWLDLMGRLKSGVSLEQAQAGVTVQLRQFLTNQWGSHVPSGNLKEIQGDYIRLTPGGKGISHLRFYYSQPLHILMVVVSLILLIACANVANLLLSRATARQREISMRLAMGASRARLVRQLLTESLLLAGLGGAPGVLLAVWAAGVLATLVAENDPLNLNPDAWVLGFTLAVGLLTSVLFGLAPALRATHVELAPALKANASGLSGPETRRFGLGKALVVFQVSCSLPLLMGAGLFTRSLVKLASQSSGFDQEHILLVQIDPRLANYKPSQLGSLYRQLLDRLNALPGVRSASIAAYSPLSGSSMSGNISIGGYTPRQNQNMDAWDLPVGPRYFETEGLLVLLGRSIGPQDTETSPDVAVVNETFVQYFFQNENPIGRRFSQGEPFKSPGIEIVGVVKDAKYDSLREHAPRMIFLSLLQMTGDSAYAGNLEIRAARDPRGISQEVRRAIGEIDKNLPVLSITTFNQQVKDSLRQERIISDLSSFFGGLALLLASVGLYGLMSFAVARRTNEIGIRMALGAQAPNVLRMVMRESLFVVVLGIAAGVPAALGLARLVASQLFDLSSADPATLTAATLMLLATSALASYIPARRATKVDPMVALRYE